MCKTGEYGNLTSSKRHPQKKKIKKCHLLETSAPPHRSVNLSHTAQASPLPTAALQPLQFPLLRLLLHALTIFLTFLGNFSNFTMSFPR